MLSLHQIKKRLVSYFENHAQINSVVFEDDFEFNAERNLTYPVVGMEFLDASVSGKLLNYSFKVVLGDMVSMDDSDLQDEVVSDMLLVAEDFLSFLQNEEGWVFDKTTSIQPFKDDGGDRVCGVVFRVVLSVVRSQNTCATPLK